MAVCGNINRSLFYDDNVATIIGDENLDIVDDDTCEASNDDA